ncbi:hypothetical protein H6G00_00545 [Leptolyngbya sp. FACHB-541]|uniref:hypothetical protein n=1 Tax=Leptolyngbya sp. FACHB-541 TaxID=2692810 RepID=UPI001688F379|nr:hypothetical protein [Leptolyngbya sp. FACHB-541]MBD1995117.1 hypothetical protein [Leptolyngbya sp. FACHB-541]
MATGIATRSKHTRLVSFENSNSWIKRHDSEGTLVIQAGYRENPTAYARHDEENPIVIIDGQLPRWYGALACQGQHVRIHGRSKIETAREAFSACLRPSDDGRDLIVVSSHWDVRALDALKAALEGQYKVIRNGVEIRCVVTQVLPVLEGMGTYNALQPSLRPGSTLLIELGFGTAEEFLIDGSGEIVDGRPVDNLGIYNLVNAIADDPAVRALATDASGTINISLISRCLQCDTLGKIDQSNWQAIKAKYVAEYLKTFQGYIKTNYAAQSQAITNIVLTGGGAALLSSIQPKVAQVFTIPDRPQTASVRGSYEHQMSLVGV